MVDDPFSPFLLGSYRVEEQLGEGGMGVVYRAFDTRRGRHVALKVLGAGVAADPGYRERFRRESQLAAQLNSPHVIPIHDFGELDDGRLFIDMRLCAGTDLARLIERNGPLDAARSVEVVSQLAHALDVAHEHGLVHRDVKPANAMVDVWGDRDFVYLVDFGIVKALSDSGSRAVSLTGTGAFVGTPAYMAPELFTDDVPATARADVYALGCVLHESLTGRPPFAGTNIGNIIHQHLAVDVVPPSRSAPGVGPRLDEVVARALAKAPGDRWRTAGELAAAARAALVPAPGAPAPAAPRPGAAAPGAAARGAGGPGATPRVSAPTDIPESARPEQSPPRAVAAPEPPPSRPASGRPVPAGGSAAPVAAGGIRPPGGAPLGAPRTTRPRRRPARWIATGLVLAVATVLYVANPGNVLGYNEVGGLAVSSDGRTVATVGARSADLTLRAPARLQEQNTVPLNDGGADGASRNVALSPDGRTAFTNESSGTIPSLYFVDLRGQYVMARLPLPEGSGPSEMVVSTDGRKLYVSLRSSRQLAVVDVASRTFTTLALPGAGELALSRDGSVLLVASAYTNTFSVVDTRTDTVIRDVDLPSAILSGEGSGITGLAVSPSGSTAYLTVPSDNSGTVRVVDLGSGEQRGRIPFTGEFVRDAALSSDGRTFFVLDGPTIHVFDVVAGAERTAIPVPVSKATRIVLSPDAATAYVFQSGPGEKPYMFQYGRGAAAVSLRA